MQRSQRDVPRRASPRWRPALLALLFAGACESTQLAPGDSTLVASAALLDLGRVYVGAESRATFVLSAPGDLAVRYASGFRGDAWGFRVGPATGRLVPNGAVEMVVTFRPEAAGERDAELVMTGDQKSGGPVVVRLRATALAAPDCEDGNGCTIDTFDPVTGTCSHEAAPLACDDFDACTTSDTCVEGICLGQGVVCDDGDVCTDDLCDPREGCVHLPTSRCDDGNPCTRDICDPRGGCRHEVLDDGTPCNDGEMCTVADICVMGRCVGVNLDDGTPCDDGDPCSKNDQCVSGRCLDPTYRPPGVGELKFITDVGALGAGASENPIIDRDGAVMVGLVNGVAAVDRCGEIAWTNEELGPVRFGAAVSVPGLLSVPVGSRILDLDTETGEVQRTLEVGLAFPPVTTASTATASVRILDIAVRASGALVVSLLRETEDAGEIVAREGLLAEVDRLRIAVTPFRSLGARAATRLAIDQDESVVAVLSDAPGEPTRRDRLVRFGVTGTSGTWSSSELEVVRTDVALGDRGQVLWSAGLVAVDRSGEPRQLLAPPPDAEAIELGAPVVDRGRIYMVLRRGGVVPPTPGPSFAPGGTYHLLALTASTGATIYDVELPGTAAQVTPVVDALGNVFVVTGEGQVIGANPQGDALFSAALPLGPASASALSLTVTPQRVLVVVSQGRVFGVQSVAPLGISTWPRHRRDNLSTSHR